MSISASPSSTPSPLASPTSPASSMPNRRVLLCLDAQLAPLSPPPLGIPASSTVLKNITHILTTARAALHPPLIVHVRNAGDRGEPDEPHAPGWALAVPPIDGEEVVDKRKNNAFAGTRLGELIVEDAEVVVVGLQTDFSLRAIGGDVLDDTLDAPGPNADLLPSLPTFSLPLPLHRYSLSYNGEADRASAYIPACSAALARGNDVLLIRGAHGTYDRVEILYGGGVTPAKQVEAEIEEELEEAGVVLMGMEDVGAIFDDR